MLKTMEMVTCLLPTFLLLTAANIHASTGIHFVTQHIPIAFPHNSIALPIFQSPHLLEPPGAFTTKCTHPLRTAIDWSTQVEASVYSTPVIRTAGTHHNHASSAESILASTYVHFIEALNAKNGHVLSGWPLEFHGNEFPSSPMLHDVNHDGNKEIIVVNKHGHLVVVYVNDAGTFLRDDIVYPFKLRVQNQKEQDTVQWEWVTRVLHLDHQKEYQKPERSSGIQSNTVLGPGHRVIDPRTKKKMKMKMKKDWRIDSWNELTNPSAVPFVQRTNKGDIDLNDDWTTLASHVLASPTLYNNKLYIATSYFNDETSSSATASVSAIAVSCWTLGVFCKENEEGCQSSTYPTQQWTTIIETSFTLRLTAYSSPAVVDLNGDGQLDVLVGTSSGRLYKMDGTTGSVAPKTTEVFSSLRFGEIQGDLSVESLNTKASPTLQMNVVVVDMSGNVICLNHDGSMVWSVNVQGEIPSGASLVRSGTEVHVYVVTSAGDVWGLRGSDGTVVAGFPLKVTQARLMTSVTPLVVRRQGNARAGRPAKEVVKDLEHGAGGGGGGRGSGRGSGGAHREEDLHLIVPAMDGKLYIVGDASSSGGSGGSGRGSGGSSKRTGKCTTVIDVGEHMYADVIVRGTVPNEHVHFHPNVGRHSGQQQRPEMGHPQEPLLTSFVVATMHGNVMSIVVDDSAYLSRDQWNGGSGSFRRAAVDVGDGAITLSSHKVQVVVGHVFHIQFYIHAARNRRQGPYKVAVLHGNRIVGQATYTTSGAHTIELEMDQPGLFVLDVTSTNAHQMVYSTTCVVDYNTRLASSVVNMITVPMVAMTVVALVVAYGK